MQKRSKLRGEVQEVAATRTNVARLAENRQRGQLGHGPRVDGVLALYGVLRAHTQAFVKKKIFKRSNAGFIEIDVLVSGIEIREGELWRMLADMSQYFLQCVMFCSLSFPLLGEPCRISWYAANKEPEECDQQHDPNIHLLRQATCWMKSHGREAVVRRTVR